MQHAQQSRGIYRSTVEHEDTQLETARSDNKKKATTERKHVQLKVNQDNKTQARNRNNNQEESRAKAATSMVTK